MTLDRRDFLRASALAAGALGLGLPRRARAAREPAPPPARAPLRILILGGTGFIGPYQVHYAVSRGHRVTVFNRGRRQAGLPAPVEHLVGDRNGQLDALRGRQWDVVIDNPTTLPRWVRDAARVLQGNVGRYVFISTISVYADTRRPVDEGTALAEYRGADAMAETEVTPELYGPLKVLSEREAERWFPGRTTVIRPGLIVGPGDPTDRFTYWPVRIDRGGEVLAPGDGTDPVQFIDARDLSEWTIRMAEQGETGTYNATGPRSELSVVGMLEGIRAATGARADFTWVDAAFLEERQVYPWSDMPVWVPGTGDSAGFARVSVARALAKGLTFRPLATTTTETLAWFRTLPAERQAELRAGLAPEREAEVLAAWKARG